MMTERIPETDSIQEMARFWDTHDLTDFDDQLEEVVEPVFDRDQVVQVHIPSRDAEAVESIARSQGIGPAELIRAWVLEKLHAPS